MIWDIDELSDRDTFVKRRAQPAPLHRSETISVFGATDAPADYSSNMMSPDRSSGAGTPAPETDAAMADHQSRIPRLPVPKLKETCELYLQSLEGLVTAEEYTRTERYVEEFTQPGGIGEHLQSLLEAHEASKPGPSWLEGFWDDAYLCTRDCVAININYFFGFEDHPKHATHGTQIGRAASLIRGAAEIYTAVRDRTLPLDTERGAPLCMSQYRRVFCASRIPEPNRDRIVTYSTAALLDHERLSHTTTYERVTPRHIVVLVRNRFFKVDVIDAATGGVIPLEEIVEMLAIIVRVAKKAGAKAGPPVGVFTTLNRDDWASQRARLVELGNEANLVAIQQAIMLLCIDGVACESTDELARLLLHGAGTNRWFDRHCLIVSLDGRAGINFEHSVGDGITTLRVADGMYRYDCEHGLSNAEVDAIVARVNATEKPSADRVKELAFRVDGPVDAKMKEAYEAFCDLIKSNETMTLNFKHYGGNFIKKSGFSPDAYVQLSFQLAHYRLFGRLDATYEAASTRAFLHGRTEVVRSVTRAAADFCEAAQQPVLTRRINSKVPNQIDLMRNASDAHVVYMKRAKVGRGVDRHMLGLRRMCIQNNIEPPALFTDPNFARSSHWILSTSHCGSAALSLFGFGPVVSDGFGLGYMIKNDSVNVCVTSKYTHRLMSSTIFSTILESSLLHMRAIVEADWEKRQAQRPLSLDFVHPTAFADFEYRGAAGFVYASHAPRRSLYSHASNGSSHFDPDSNAAMSGGSEPSR